MVLVCVCVCVKVSTNSIWQTLEDLALACSSLVVILFLQLLVVCVSALMC